MVAGTAAANTVPPHLARQLIAPRTQTDRRRITRDGGGFCIAPRSQRADVAARVETLVRAHPSQGERHNQALLALAHHRVTLHAMIRDTALTTRSQQHNAA